LRLTSIIASQSSTRSSSNGELLAPVIAITLPSIVTGQKLRVQPRLKLAIVASIVLNADLGEGFGVRRLGDDDAMLGIVTSANVACGFHAGDPAGLLRVCRLATERGVRIGAQVSYPDMAGFGRRFIDVTPEDLTTGHVAAVDGSAVEVHVESVCVHGDSPGAVQIASAVRDRLKADGIDLKAFC
jgi:lactam utilization protein B